MGRKIIEKKHWKILRKFYADGVEFSSKSTMVCPHCQHDQAVKVMLEKVKQNSELKARQIEESSPLYPLLTRKNGVPSSYLKYTVDDALVFHTNAAINGSNSLTEDWACSACTSINLAGEDTCHCCLTVRNFFTPHSTETIPLVPGIYNVVSRNWLRLWRQYSRSASISTLPPLDCTGLLCSLHGLLIVPPHIEEFITGIRRNLLGNLADYPGDLYEILTPEEYDLLNQVVNGPAASAADFAVRFFCDGEGTVEWNIEICHTCNPFENYCNGEKKSGSNRKKDSKRVNDRKGRSSSFEQINDFITRGRN